MFPVLVVTSTALHKMIFQQSFPLLIDGYDWQGRALCFLFVYCFFYCCFLSGKNLTSINYQTWISIEVKYRNFWIVEHLKSSGNKVISSRFSPLRIIFNLSFRMILRFMIIYLVLILQLIQSDSYKRNEVIIIFAVDPVLFFILRWNCAFVVYSTAHRTKIELRASFISWLLPKLAGKISRINTED